MEANIKPLDLTGMTHLSNYDPKDSWYHLQVWFMNNKPADNMIYKEATEKQIMFIRDEFFNFFPTEMIKKIEVVSTHTSKSIKLPVYHVVLNDGIELVMRGNFHDWKISVNAPFEIELPEKILSNYTLKGEKINSCYCEGFSDEWIWDSYLNNKKKFTIEIGASLYDLYTFLFIFSCEVDKQSKAIEAL